MRDSPSKVLHPPLFLTVGGTMPAFIFLENPPVFNITGCFNIAALETAFPRVMLTLYHPLLSRSLNMICNVKLLMSINKMTRLDYCLQPIVIIIICLRQWTTSVILGYQGTNAAGLDT